MCVHDPVVFVVMESLLRGERAKDVTDRLPFDGAIHVDTIGFTGGLWLMWNAIRWKLPLWPRLNRKFTSLLRYELLIFPGYFQ